MIEWEGAVDAKVLSYGLANLHRLMDIKIFYLYSATSSNQGLGMSTMRFFFILSTLTLVFNSKIVFSDEDARNLKPEQVYKYEPNIVTLRGKLTQKAFFGPPGYGENPKSDSKEKQYILVLGDQIDIEGAAKAELNNPAEKGVTDIMLVISDFKKIPLEKCLGKNITLRGTLYHSHTGHHHTNILMTVEKILSNLN